MREWVAAGLLLHASVVDIRHRRIPNGALVLAGGVGCLWAVVGGGAGGLIRALVGGAAAIVWWPCVRWLGLGRGDLKLAMALGILLGPGAALEAPAWGFVACAVWSGLEIVWCLRRHVRWRGREIAFAPWIALGTGLFAWVHWPRV